MAKNFQQHRTKRTGIENTKERSELMLGGTAVLRSVTMKASRLGRVGGPIREREWTTIKVWLRTSCRVLLIPLTRLGTSSPLASPRYISVPYSTVQNSTSLRVEEQEEGGHRGGLPIRSRIDPSFQNVYSRMWYLPIEFRFTRYHFVGSVRTPQRPKD